MHTGLDFLPGYRVQYVLSHPPQAVEEAVRGVDYGAQKTLGVYVLEFSNVPHKRHHCTVRPPGPIHQQRIFGHIGGHSSDHVLDKEGQQGSFGRIYGRIYFIFGRFLVPFAGSEYENWSSLLVHSAYIEARVYIFEGGACQGLLVGPLLGAFVLHRGLLKIVAPRSEISGDRFVPRLREELPHSEHVLAAELGPVQVCRANQHVGTSFRRGAHPPNTFAQVSLLGCLIP
mmetsp:Transcript_19302/g.41807  ORF Transcript_19302/g.41807 Transcript_19302/m.41807 type:complete len:229 (+) Transcript_19302:1764-2450(+)